ncbi:MAG: hypothetical protein V3U52_02510 [Thermoplasmata archaeon]
MSKQDTVQSRGERGIKVWYTTPKKAAKFWKVSSYSDKGTIRTDGNILIYRGRRYSFDMPRIVSIDLQRVVGGFGTKQVEVVYETPEGVVQKAYFMAPPNTKALHRTLSNWLASPTEHEAAFTKTDFAEERALPSKSRVKSRKSRALTKSLRKTGLTYRRTQLITRGIWVVMTLIWILLLIRALLAFEQCVTLFCFESDAVVLFDAYTILVFIPWLFLAFISFGSEEELKEEDNFELLMRVPGLKQPVQDLREMGYTWKKLRTASAEGLMKVKGIGEVTARKVITYVRKID